MFLAGILLCLTSIAFFTPTLPFGELGFQEMYDSLGWRLENLPLAWNNKLVVPVEKCPSCPGRMGYVAHPVNGIRGMFRVVVRITHTELIKGHKDYEFIVSPR